MKQHRPAALLFDLDGTLLNTAPDIINAMNVILRRHNRPREFEHSDSYHAHGGSNALLADGFNMAPEDPLFETIKNEFLTEYKTNIAVKTHYYSGIEDTIHTLNSNDIPWGIITNKPRFLTHELLQHFPLLNKTPFWLAGDDLPQIKPSAEPLLYACKTLNLKPQQCYYIGDTETDCIAAQGANMASITMLYGYHKHDEDPQQWQSDHCFESGDQLHTWLTTLLDSTT